MAARSSLGSPRALAPPARVISVRTSSSALRPPPVGSEYSAFPMQVRIRCGPAQLARARLDRELPGVPVGDVDAGLREAPGELPG